MDFRDSRNNIIVSGIIVLAVLAVGFFVLGREPELENTPVLPGSSELEKEVISVKNVEIKEDNFTGKMPIISGRSELAKEAQAYVEGLVYDFKIRANKEVPEMIAEFGPDTAAANYSLEIEASQLTSVETESIVLSAYMYTGGANGNSFYKVITSSKQSGKILLLTDVIKNGQEQNFVNLVKNKLLTWSPEGGREPVVFEESVNSLVFSNFTNWSLDDKNFNIYFAKYDVGPGALGAVVLPIPRAEMKSILNTAI